MSAQSGKPPTAGPRDTGRACPYCRFLLKEGAPIVRCAECDAAHHADCWEDNSGCAVIGCAGGPRPRGTASAGGDPGETREVVARTRTPRSPGPPGDPPRSSAPGPAAARAPGRPWLPTALIILAATIAGVAVAIFLSRQSNGAAKVSADAPPRNTVTKTTVTVLKTLTVRAPSPPPKRTPAVPAEERAPPPTAQSDFSEAGSSPTGRDASGFNIGPGCSDNPTSPLPGCADSPNVPAGDPSGTCSNGITIDRHSTSCGLAENVYANYRGDGTVRALSPERDRDYTFTCKTAGPGTTGYTICLGKAGASPLYLRWHP
jgi:hypothetical protein